MKSGNPNILIIKLSAIGDVVHSLPFLEVVREHFPSAMIDWVIEEDASSVVEGHQDLDELIIFPRKSWVKRCSEESGYLAVGKEVARFLKDLRRRRYDMVVDLQGLLKSGILTFFARGKRKIALNGGREGSSLFVSERVAFPGPDIHALERYLCVARYLGVTGLVRQGKIPVQETDKRYIDTLLAELQDGIPLIAVNPMAKWETKLWELHRFASLADKINENCAAEIIFTGNEGDKGAIETILSAMKTNALNVAGKTTLKQLAYLYQRCAVVISTDTGPMHIAASMDSPVVIALFGPTSPLRTGPYGARHRVIRAGVACSPCFKKKCDDKSCMREITVDQVFETVRHVIRA